MTPTLTLRGRTPDGLPVTVSSGGWGDARIAVVICDMWDTTQCRSAARRVVEMAPRLNEVVARLRQDGALIVHAPAGCMAYYAGFPARTRVQRGSTNPRVRVDWNEWDAAREAPLPAALGDDTPCSCEPGQACTAGSPPYPWTHQIDTIEIDSNDAITDDGGELLALLEDGDFQDVLVTGVHLNRCVLGRPYGIRQLVYWRKRPVLCRDLTDSFHRSALGHEAGNEAMIAHVERYWCPSITSDQIVGGMPFRFRAVG